MDSVIKTENVRTNIYHSIKDIENIEDTDIHLCGLIIANFLSYKCTEMETHSTQDVIESSTCTFGCHGHKPTISIENYVQRCIQYLPTITKQDLIMVLSHIDNIVTNCHVPLVSNIVHRLFITSLLIVSKFNSESFYKNSYYTKIAGVQIDELNKLEREFLIIIDFKVWILDGEYQATRQNLNDYITYLRDENQF